MPFRSEAERRYLWANKPDVAQKIYDDSGGKSTKGLPYHKRSKKRTAKRSTRHTSSR